MTSFDKKQIYLSILFFGLMLFGWYKALVVAPTEASMGDVYRIIFLHVPCAAAAMGLASFGLLIAALIALRWPDEKFLRAQRAWAEVGLLFTCLTLFSGSLWGKPTWGTYWTWEPRLTTTLLLAILFVAFLLLYNALPSGKQRIRSCAILGIVIFVDVPIIYKSVSWWRTLHQPASLIAERGRTMAPEMLSVLITSLVFTLGFAFTLWWMRLVNLAIKDKIDAASYQAMRG